MIILEILGHVLFWLTMIGGIAIIVVGLPGTFLIVVNSFVFGWFTGFVDLTAGVLLGLLAIALVAEGIEFFLGAAAAARFGGSKMAIGGAIVGGFLGAIWLTSLLPVFGTIAGAFIGAFGGAALFEYIGTKDWDRSLQAGYGAFLGALGGRLTKIAAAVSMIVIVAFRIF
jgi:hypothetical protein